MRWILLLDSFFYNNRFPFSNHPSLLVLQTTLDAIIDWEASRGSSSSSSGAASSSTGRLAVQPGLDARLDEYRRTYADLPNFLSQVIALLDRILLTRIYDAATALNALRARPLHSGLIRPHPLLFLHFVLILVLACSFSSSPRVLLAGVPDGAGALPNPDVTPDEVLAAECVAISCLLSLYSVQPCTIIACHRLMLLPPFLLLVTIYCLCSRRGGGGEQSGERAGASHGGCSSGGSSVRRRRRIRRADLHGRLRAGGGGGPAGF